MTYVSCICGWRGTSNTYDGHVCYGGGPPRIGHEIAGWPNDRRTFERLGNRAIYAVNPKWNEEYAKIMGRR